VPIPHTLTSYFSADGSSPAKFLKSLNAAKTNAFTTEDQNEAIRVAMANDTSGKKLWALLSRPSLPEAIDKWIWPATSQTLATRFGEHFDAATGTSHQLWRTLREQTGRDLRSTDKATKEAAMNWLRIGVVWLAKMRSLDLWLAAEDLPDLIFRTPEREARGLAVRSLQKGKAAEFRLVAALSFVRRLSLEVLRRERDEARLDAGRLRQQAEQKEETISELREQVSSLQGNVTQITAELTALRGSLEAEGRRLGQDIDELKADFRVLLRERLHPILSEAVGALEITPPVLRVATRRLQNALEIIQEKAP
jgi:hypothetical protein